MDKGSKSKDPHEARSSCSRRDFVRTSATAVLGTSLLSRGALASSLVTAAGGERPVLHIIGHSHIDAAWLWPWTDSSDVVLTTFRSALDRMQETPGFKYSHSSMIHYQWVEKADPKMFAEILARIQEGRWEVVGGWPVEPDCNIPSTESFARHCLYGKTYASRKLQTDVNVGFNPDSFGHAAGLPTILKNAGYKYYVFLRPQEHEGVLPRLFWWEGSDGSRIMTYRIYGSYDWLAKNLTDAASHSFPSGCHHGAFFLGVGDHGGAVTKAQLQEIVARQTDSTLPELRWSTLREFFTSVEQSISVADLPVMRGELQHHARGCYSACGEEKFQNRRAEHELFNAESVALISTLSQGRSYPGTELAGAWERVLFNQFHDVLAGTSLYSDYQNARDGIGYACQIAMETSRPALEALAKQVDLHDVPEGAVFAYNPLPWRRKALLEFHYQTNTTTEHFSYLKARDGSQTPLQMRPSDSMTDFYPRLSSWVDLPACGYKVFTLERGAQSVAAAYSQYTTVSDNSFGIKSLRAPDGTELLAANLGLVVIGDKSDTWAHGVAAFRQELGRPTFISSRIVEDGSVTRVTRQKLKWQSSDIMVDIAEFSANDAIELRFVINWQEHEQILKLEVPTAFHSPRVFAKVPGAALERTANGNEEPYQDWVALQGSRNEQDYVLALANSATYSYDCLDGLLRTVLIRSAPYARHYPNKVAEDGIAAWQDQGRQERTFWLLRAKGIYTDLFLDREARSLQTPAGYVLDSRHRGDQPWERSYLEVSPSQVEVLAIKQAEGGGPPLLRFQERSGQHTLVRIISPLFNLSQGLSLLPWELKTISLLPSQVKTTSIMESNGTG
ncbi:Alpha-mannosidase [Acidisarcina polymorpha]|uniref:Alpha-mannosidase n=1 Tax=Acidisarcina polymorpha TaxID=2211140 RepID=A0A2Z5G231_9BACT|nr:alpha-mannosidase [Acidisarcina polymorpha]AXC12705.1 Alpha-mannosidase [Acidisarcina polymorpha]